VARLGLVRAGTRLRLGYRALGRRRHLGSRPLDRGGGLVSRLGRDFGTRRYLHLRGSGRRHVLLRLDLAAQPFAVGLAPDPVRLGVLDRRRVALHPDAERQAQVEGLLVREAKLPGKLIYAYLLRQLCGSVLPI
jgi:hypothetical protein